MAKSSAPVVSRAPKSKSAVQIAKRDQNVALAAERLKRLQARQRLLVDLRRAGHTGTDDQIIGSFNRQQELRDAVSYCSMVFNLPQTGQIIQRWLKNRVQMAPVPLRRLIEQFLNRDQNAEMKADVLAAWKAVKIAA